MNDIDSALQERVSFLVPLNKLPAERTARLLEQSELLELRKKDVLFRQGDRDDYTFYLLDGDIEMYADDSLIKRVSGGEGASFQPLSQLQPRQMSAIAKSKARVLRLKRSLLEQLLSMNDAPSAVPTSAVEVEEMEASQSTDWLMNLLQSELFTRIPPSNIQGLLDTLETVSLKRGEAVVKQGEPGDYYYAVQSGTCEVVRVGAKQREIRLAELGPGDTFGEEALISGSKRNATVRMTSDGELARLTKDDFTRLIKAPLLHAVDRAEAERFVADGARWLDVRFEDEHGHNGLPDSRNIPLGTLRTRMDELDPAIRYVTYCDTGGRSSAAAFLLAEKGFDVAYVAGGAVSEPAPPAPPADKAAPAARAGAAPKTPTAAVKAAATAASVPTADTAVLEAAVRASSLGAEVAKANLTIEQAHKLMAEAAAMKAEADSFVAQKLAREREQLAQEQAALAQQLAETEALKAALTAQQASAAADARRQQEELARHSAEHAQAVEARLAEQQQRIERENALLQERLTTAEALEASLDAQQRAAEAESARLHAEVARRSAELEQQAQNRLAAQQEKLAEETATLERRLAEAGKLREALSLQQRAAEAETSALQAEVERRSAELEQQAEARLKQEQARLETVYRKQAEQLESMQAGREAELREQLRVELARERGNFESAVARSNEELERARDERAAALAAKEAAAAEARQVIAEFKAQQQTLLAEQQAVFNAERERLREEAARIEKLRAETSRVRQEAAAVKAAAERELAAARANRAATVTIEVDTEIIEIEQRASAAGRDLEQALQAESAAAHAARQNEDELERTYDTASEVKDLLRRELDDWVDEQESVQESTLQREILSRQKEMVERIRARAAAAKAQANNHTKSLLDEIEDQLQRR